MDSSWIRVLLKIVGPFGALEIRSKHGLPFWAQAGLQTWGPIYIFNM